MSTERRLIAWAGNIIEIINSYTGTRKILASKIDGLTAGATSGVLCGRLDSVGSAFGEIVTFDTPFPTVSDASGDYMAIAVGYSGGVEVRVAITRANDSMILVPDANADYVQWVVFPYSV